MSLWFSILFPPELIDKLAPISMIIAGILVEKHFVGRITTFLNAIAVNIYAAQKYPLVSQFEVWYCNIGLLIGVIALFSYASEESLPSWFYIIAFAYSSFVTGLYILLF